MGRKGKEKSPTAPCCAHLTHLVRERSRKDSCYKSLMPYERKREGRARVAEEKPTTLPWPFPPIEAVEGISPKCRICSP